MCKLTYVCALASAHTSIFVLCMQISRTKYIYKYLYIFNISYDGRFCTRTHGVRSQLEPLCVHANTHKYAFFRSQLLLNISPLCATHICLCPCKRSQIEPLCLHANTHKYTCFRSQILLYTNPSCANSHMSVPSRVLTLRTSLYTCIYPPIFICRMMDTFVQESTVRKLTYVYALASAHS